MAISLKKGENVSLTKTSPNLQFARVGAGWDARSTDGAPFDLDLSAFLVGANGKVLSDAHFIYFNKLKSDDGSIIHSPDNIDGAGDGDDEWLDIDLARVPNEIQRIVCGVTIHEAIARKQNFGMVRNANARITDNANKAELVRFDLTEDASTETAMIFAELYRAGSEWKFKAVGQGFKNGLKGLCDDFGVHAG